MFPIRKHIIEEFILHSSGSDADEQPKAVQRVAEEGLFDRRLNGLVKKAKAPSDDEVKKNVGWARVK